MLGTCFYSFVWVGVYVSVCMCVRVCVGGRGCIFFYTITWGSVFFLRSIILPDMCGWLYVCSEFLGELRKENHWEQMTGRLPLQLRRQNAVLSSGYVNFSLNTSILKPEQITRAERKQKKKKEKSKKQMDKLPYSFPSLLDSLSKHQRFEALHSSRQS